MLRDRAARLWWTDLDRVAEQVAVPRERLPGPYAPPLDRAQVLVTEVEKGTVEDGLTALGAVLDQVERAPKVPSFRDWVDWNTRGHNLLYSVGLLVVTALVFAFAGAGGLALFLVVTGGVAWGAHRAMRRYGVASRVLVVAPAVVGGMCILSRAPEAISDSPPDLARSVIAGPNVGAFADVGAPPVPDHPTRDAAAHQTQVPTARPPNPALLGEAAHERYYVEFRMGSEVGAPATDVETTVAVVLADGRVVERATLRYQAPPVAPDGDAFLDGPVVRIGSNVDPSTGWLSIDVTAPSNVCPRHILGQIAVTRLGPRRATWNDEFRELVFSNRGNYRCGLDRRMPSAP